MKYIALSILSLGLTTATFAQLNPRVGVKGGLNLMHSTIHNEGPTIGKHNYTGFGPGFYVGGLVEISGKNKSSKLKGQIELQYNYLTNTTDNVVTSTDRFNTINIPVSLKYFFQPHMSVILGMNNNIFLNGTNKVKDADKATEYINLTTYNPGVHVGFNYYFKKGFFLDLRYNYQFNTVLDIVSDDFSYKYGHGQIGLGYKF